jgi:maltose O-acetyltransferase
MLLQGRTQIGDRLRMRSDAACIEVSVASSATLSIGDDVLLLDGTSIGVTDRIEIGSGCRIGPHVQIMDNAFHRLESDRRDERPESFQIAIGDNVWIGAMALILPGASIGDDSVVAARSVVLGEVAPRSLVMGSPARQVRRL